MAPPPTPRRLTSPPSRAPSRLLLPTVRSSLPTSSVAQEWLGLSLHFDIVEERVQVKGYQMYAVEKWSVIRGTHKLALILAT